jgi:predicted TPR repeat methyltransferase
MSQTAHDTGSTLLRHAGACLRAGHLGAARAAVAALRQCADAPPALAETEARLCLAEGRMADAIAVLDGALAAVDSAGLRLLRAEARAAAGDLKAAAADAAEALLQAPGDGRAKAMLGVLMIELGRHDDAVACLRDAVQSAPRLTAAWRGLAEAHSRRGDEAAAGATFDAAIAALPGEVDLRVAAMMQAMRLRQFVRALALGEAARAEGRADARVFGLVGHALHKLDRAEAAADSYQDALRLAPEDPYVRHLVRAAGLLPDGARAPADYLVAVFDGYAGHFEQHLIDLGYRIPGIMRELVRDLLAASGEESLGRVLDLGCGTGLIGVLIADIPREHLTGIDLSANMLSEARTKGIYDDLVAADIPVWLAASDEVWDLVLAADVLCYFGALEELFAIMWHRLRQGGGMVVSIELDPAADGPDWRLGGQGRFMHRRDYVLRCLAEADLDVTALREETLRFEHGTAVPGLVIAARRRAADA